MTDALTIVVHGESGVGKSWLADTAPAPRLLLDIEGGLRFTPSAKVRWDPRKDDPPADAADSVLVTVRNRDDAGRVYQWLNAGHHPFRSVVVDSLTEMQKRIVDDLVGTSALKTQDWGALWRIGDAMVRAYRDLAEHPVRPLECVVFVCGSRTGDDGVVRPYLQGQLRDTLPYSVDVAAHMALSVGGDGAIVRTATFAPIGGVVAKDRTGKLGTSMTNPTIPQMFEAVFGGQKEVA